MIPFGNTIQLALNNKMQGRPPLGPITNTSTPQRNSGGLLSSVGGGLSNYWNNIGPGRYHNPQSPDYIQQPGMTAKPQPTNSPNVASNFLGGITGAKTANAQTATKNTSSSIPGVKTAPPQVKSLYQGGEAVAPRNLDGSLVGPQTPSVIQPLTQTTPPQVTQPVTSAPTSNPFNTAVGGLGNIASGQTDNQNTAKGAIGSMQGMITNPNPTALTAQQGLLGVSQNQTPAVTSAQSDLANFRQASPFMLSDVRNNPNVAAEVSVGRGQALGQTLSAEEAAKSNTLSAALAGQSQQITAGNEAGTMGIANEGQQLAGQQNIGSLAQTGTGQQITAGQNAGNLAQPHFNGYVGLDPLTGKPLDSTGASQAAIAGSLIDANATSASGLQQNINTIQSKSQAAGANFDYLNSLATQGGVSANSPILGSIKQKYGSTVQGNNAVAGFKAQLESVKQAYKEITGNEPNIPDDPTPSQLKTIQDSLNAFVKNNLTNYQSKLDSLKNGGNSSNNSSNDPLGIR